MSIYEQGVREGDTLLLKFKWLSFFDLNPKFDRVRVNQIYEQARWQLLSEEIDSTEEEAFMFAGLQLQVRCLKVTNNVNDFFLRFVMRTDSNVGRKYRRAARVR